MTDWIKEVLFIALPALASGFAGWLFGRGRQREEVHALEMDNVSKAIEIWRDTANQVETKYTELQKQVEQLRQSSLRLEAEHRKLSEDYRKLHQENDRLRQRVKKLENENRKLRTTIENH